MQASAQVLGDTPETTAVLAHHGQLRVEAVDSLQGLAERARAWDELLERCEHRVQCPSYAWVASHLEHLLEPGETWCCLFAWEGDALRGVLPLVAREGRRAGLSQVTLATPHGLHTLSVDLLCESSAAARVVPLLLEAMQLRFPAWSEARLPRLSSLSPTLRHVAHPEAEVLAEVELADQGSFVRTDGELQSYLDTLSPNFVRNVARVTRKVGKLPGNEVIFATGRDASPAILDEFVRLEAAGWKGTSGGAIANNPRVRAFYASVVERLHASGWLEWHLLRAEGQLLAAHLACRIGRCVYLWKIAFNEQYGAYAPGNVLIMRTLERAFADPGVDEVNCLTETPWNRNWSMPRRAYHDLILWPRRTLPVLVGYMPYKARRELAGVPAAKALYHRLLDLRERLDAERKKPLRDHVAALQRQLGVTLQRRLEQLGPLGRWALVDPPPAPAAPEPVPAVTSAPPAPPAPPTAAAPATAPAAPATDDAARPEPVADALF
jgi:CelD/BcsL family acetyltransferase involved in cellulose biosynthesis